MRRWFIPVLAALFALSGASPGFAAPPNAGARLKTPPARPEAQPVVTAPLKSIADIAHVYHGGAVIDASMRHRTFTDKAVPGILANSASMLAKQAGIDRSDDIAKIRADLRQQGLLSPRVDAALYGAVIDAAMAKGGRKFAAEYGWKVDYLRIVALGLPDDRTIKVPAVIERLARYQWLRDFRFDPSRWLRDWTIRIPTDAERYRADCDREAVPLPPDWNRGGWTRQSVGSLTEVPQALLFLALGNPVEVWASNDRGRGACIALPRWGPGKASATLGIICQSRTTGKACFWDNRPHAGGAKFTLAEMNSNSVINDWVNGHDAALVGGGKCVQCHRGGNVFLIHPDTPLALLAPAFQTNPAVRYTPLTALGWTNPAATAVPALGAGQQSCAGCHEVGNTSVEKGSYCAFLRMAANREMPGPGASRAGWGTTVPPDIATRPQFVDMIAFLKTQCGTSP